MSFYPDPNKLAASESSGTILEIKRSLRSILPLIFYFLLSLVCVISISDWLDGGGSSGRAPWFPSRWLGIVPLGFFLEIVRRRYNDLYTLSKDRVQHIGGRLSLKYTVPSIKYIDIRSLTVDQSIWGRILNFGDVLIGTSAQSDVELVVSGVVAPTELMSIIEVLRARADKTG